MKAIVIGATGLVGNLIKNAGSKAEQQRVDRDLPGFFGREPERIQNS